MNKVWKSFFSKKLGRFVVASENARSSTKANKSKNAVAVTLATVGMTISAGAFANEVIDSTNSQVFGDSNIIVDSIDSNSFGSKNNTKSSKSVTSIGESNAVINSNESTTIGKDNQVENLNTSVVVGNTNNVSEGRNLSVTGFSNQIGGFNNSVYGSSNTLKMSNSALIGDSNVFKNAVKLNVHGSNNFGISYLQEDSDVEFELSRAQEDLRNILIGSDIRNIGQSSSNIFGSLNLVDGKFVNVIGASNAVNARSSSVIGLDNFLIGDESSINGNSNSIVSNESFVAGNSNRITNDDDSLGSMNLIVGNSNALNTRTEIRNWVDSNGNEKTWRSVYTPDNNAIIGSFNKLTGSSNNVIGSSNGNSQIENNRRMVEDNRLIVEDNLPNIESWAENSNIFGSWNRFTTKNSSIIGDKNKAFNASDIGLLGNENSLGDAVTSKVIGDENSLALVGKSSIIGNNNNVGNVVPRFVGENALENDAMYAVRRNAVETDAVYPVGVERNKYPSFESVLPYLNGNPETTLIQILGDNNTVLGTESVISGNSNHVLTFGSVLSGNNVEGFISNSVALGNNNNVKNISSSLIGNNNQAGGDHLAITGQSNNVGGSRSLTKWVNDSETGNSHPVVTHEEYRVYGSTVSGNFNNVWSDNTQVIGNSNKVIGDNFHQDNLFHSTINHNSILGNANELRDVSGVLVGGSFNKVYSRSEKTLENNIVLGFDNISASNSATIVGSENIVNTDNGISIGMNNRVGELLGPEPLPLPLPEPIPKPRIWAKSANLNESSMLVEGTPDEDVIEPPNNLAKTSAIAIGTNNNAVNGGIVLGSDSYAESFGLALGNSARATPNNVALGSFSVADGSTLNKDAYLVGGKAIGEVNVGNRRITGVVAGSDPLDAVNVQQLTYFAEGLGEAFKGVVKYDLTAEEFGFDFTRATLEGEKATIGKDSNGISIVESGGTTLANVATALNADEAVNKGQMDSEFAKRDDVLAGVVKYDRDAVTNAVIFNKATLGGNKVVIGKDSNGISIVESGGTTLANVATAINADEAVNKGQMDSEFAKLNDQIGGIKGALQYEILESGDVNYGVSILKGDTAVIAQDSTHAVDVVESGGTKIKNVANAEFADEAINLGQLNLAIASLNDTYGEATLGAVQYDINDGVVNYAKARLRGDTASIVTDSNNIDVVEKGGTVIANVANATKADEAVNLGVLQSSLKPVQMNVEENTTDINTINRVGVFFGSNMNGAVNKSTLILGDASTNTLTQIKNVANAESRTDAINYGQVIDMFGEIPTFESLAGVVKYDRDANSNEVILGKVTLGGDKAELGADVNGIAVVTSGGTTLANVATAQNADEAVNKGQMESELAKRDQVIQLNTDNIVINQSNIAINQANILNIQETGVFFERNQFGATDYSKLILGNGFGSTQIKNVANASDRSDAVNYGQVLDMFGDVVKEADLAGVVKYEQNEDGSYNKNSLVLSGDKAELGKDQNGTTIVTSGGTTISNVANAEKADEAINKGQFDSAINDLLGSTVQYDRNEDGSVNKNSITLDGLGGTTITNVANGKIEVGSTDAVNGGQIAELLGSIEIPEQLVTQDPNTKEINVATNKDGKVVNVNGTEGDRVIAGVADGKVSSTSNEAITGKQLSSTNNAMAEYLGGNASWDESIQEFNAPTYKVDAKSYNDVGSAISALDARDQALDSKINNLEQSFTQQINATNNHIRKVEKRLSAGIAQAMAMESAPHVAGKLSYAIGAAHHGGENAVGATFRLTAESGKWSITTGIAGASEGDASFRVGFSGVIN